MSELSKIELRILKEIVSTWTPEKDEIYPDLAGLSVRTLDSIPRHWTMMKVHQVIEKLAKLGFIYFTVRRTVFRPTRKARELIEIGRPRKNGRR